MHNHTYLVSSERVLTLVVLGIALCSNPALAAPDAFEAPVAPRTESADSLFADAAAKFKAGAHAEALSTFMRVAELKDSPNVELYIGYCHMELGNEESAYRAFSQAVRLAVEDQNPKYAATRQAAQEQLAMLNHRLARLTISVVEDVESVSVSVNDRRLQPSELGSPIVDQPGIHQIVAECRGAKRVAREVELEKGGNKTVTLLFEKEAKTVEQTSISMPDARQTGGNSWTTYGFVAAGLGLAGWGLFAVAGANTKATYDRLSDECSAGCADAAHRELISSGKSQQAVANVGLALGIVGTAVGSTLLYLGLSGDDRVQPVVEAGSKHAVIAIQGRL